MSGIFATTSGKGGVGKSSVATGLGFAFTHLSKSVLLVDMDEGLPSLDMILGIDDLTVLDLIDALDREDIKSAVYETKTPNLYLVPAPTKTGLINPEKLESFIRKAEALYDVVILDFPAGLDFSLYSALPRKTVFLTVATPDPVSVRDAAAVSRALEEKQIKSRLIINRFSLKESLKRKYNSIDGIIDISSLQLLGLVPEDRELNAITQTHRLRKRNRAMKAFLRIAQRLLDAQIKLPKLKKI